MNFVRLYIGDYMRDTGSLSVAEHGAYMLMLLHHYATEQPLPSGRELHRLIRAETKVEREAADAVLARFWVQTDGGYINIRAGEEIARANHRGDVNREIAVQREATKRARKEHEQTTNRARKEHDSPTDTRHQTPDKISVPTEPHPPEPGQEPTADRRTPEIPTPYDAIVGLYHEALPSLPRVRLMTAKRQTLLRNRWRWVLTSRRPDNTRRATSAAEALDWLREFFALAAKNDFVVGREGRSGDHASWQADIDYLLSDKGLRQVVEKTREAA